MVDREAGLNLEEEKEEIKAVIYTTQALHDYFKVGATGETPVPIKPS